MKTKTKQTRHHGSSKRPNRLEISLNDDEMKTVVELATKAGMTKIPTFARKLLLGGGVIPAPITPDDRKDINQLSKIGSNLWRLRKDLEDFGVDPELLRDLELFKIKFKKILDYYIEKIKA